MSGTMTLHCGAWEATADEVKSVAVPAMTESYTPLAHMGFAGELLSAAMAQGLEIERVQYALANKGNRMFFVADTKDTGTGISLAIGGRNSYDKSMAAAALAGSRVWICDNLAMSAEVTMREIHVGDIYGRLRSRAPEVINQLLDKHGGFERNVKHWQECDVDQKWVDHALMQALRNDALHAHDLEKVEREFHKPTIEAWSNEPPTAWRLYNAATQVAKEWTAAQQFARTQLLTQTFREVFPREAVR